MATIIAVTLLLIAPHYVTKENEDAPHSRNHSGVSDDAPRSEQAIRCRKEKAKEKEKSKGKR